MNRWKKIAAGIFLSASLIMGNGLAMPEAAAASRTAEWIYGAAALAFVSHYYSELDNHGQKSLLDEIQKQTGVYESAEADSRVHEIYDRIVNTGTVGRSYKVYVSPDDDINAFMSLGGVLCVNKGALDAMDDDELAYIMGHEIAHGEKHHSVSGIKKQVGLAAALNIYLADDPGFAAYLLSNIAANYVSNAVFTKDQEKEADHLGFEYLVEAGYNPGAGAAAMQVLYDKYGESSPSGIREVLAPGNHPKTSDRINKNVKWMYQYSGNHVNVKDNWIMVNGERTFQPAASGKYTDKERGFLTAGKLASIYHKGNVQDASFNEGDQAVYVGETEIYAVHPGENSRDILKNLNKGIEKDRGRPVADHFEIDKEKVRLEKQKNEKNDNGVKDQDVDRGNLS